MKKYVSYSWSLNPPAGKNLIASIATNILFPNGYTISGFRVSLLLTDNVGLAKSIQTVRMTLVGLQPINSAPISNSIQPNVSIATTSFILTGNPHQNNFFADVNYNIQQGDTFNLSIGLYPVLAMAVTDSIDSLITIELDDNR